MGTSQGQLYAAVVDHLIVHRQQLALFAVTAVRLVRYQMPSLLNVSIGLIHSIARLTPAMS